MGWDNITGDAKIVNTGGNANEVKLENGKAKKVRLIGDKEPYSYFEHTIEVESIENGKTVKTFRTVRCQQTSKNPNAKCPLCDGQQLKRRVRNAINVWDYDVNGVQKLNQGESIFKPMATTRKLGIDIMGVDWALMRTGETRNDTEYTATNLGATPFALPADAVLFDIEAEYAPHTVEEMMSIVESCGLTWEQVITPPVLEFPTLQQALAHVMPNGKYKDQTFQQIWDADPSPKGMINFLATKSDRITAEKAAAQVIMVNLGGADIPGVPKGGVASTPSTPTQAPTTNSPVGQPTQTPAPVGQPTQNSGDRQGKINQINQLLSTKEKFVTGGFGVIMETMKTVSGGKTNIVEFTDAELDAMLVECNK